MEVAEGTVVAGKYRLEKQLARGGMGSVWIARHLQLESSVAVKFMDPIIAAAPAARMRFEREAKSAAQLHSPHVVTIHDYGIEVGTPFLVMELLRGEDLGARIKRLRTLSLPTVAGIVTHVARALRLAHEAGIVHRDLKPGNIFLTTNDDSEIAKVLDFGIAKMMGLTASVDEDLPTKTDQILGSPQYMSPEQAKQSRDVDHRTDLWALGVIAYRAVTGKLPFAGDSIATILVKICTEPAPPPSSYVPGLPLTVDRFFERALAKPPEHRFQSAPELAAAFAQAAGVGPNSEPLRARPAGEKRLGMRTLPFRLADMVVGAPASPLEASAVTAPPVTEPLPPTPLPRITDRLPPPPGATVDRGRSSAPDYEGPTQPRHPQPSASGGDGPTVSPELFGGATPASLSMSNQDHATHPLPPAPGAPASTMLRAGAPRARLFGVVAAAGLALAIVGALAGRAVVGASSSVSPSPAVHAVGAAPVPGEAAPAPTSLASAAPSPASETPSPTTPPAPSAVTSASPPTASASASVAKAAAARAQPGAAGARPKATKPVRDPLGSM